MPVIELNREYFKPENFSDTILRLSALTTVSFKCVVIGTSVTHYVFRHLLDFRVPPVFVVSIDCFRKENLGPEESSLLAFERGGLVRLSHGQNLIATIMRVENNPAGNSVMLFSL